MRSEARGGLGSVALAGVAVAALTAAAGAPPAGAGSIGAAPVVPTAEPDDGFERADRPRRWDLPRDHRAHPETALEWWYLTGDLRAGDRRFGYQATFFRAGLRADVPARPSPFAARELILWHGAVTDVTQGRFDASETTARAAAGWAGASAERLDVHLHENRLREVLPDRWELRARAGGWRLELDYRLNRPPVLHGREPGLSIKGPEPGQASHHVSRVHLPTTGTLVSPAGERFDVSGPSWFDQEFGSSQLSEEQVGWDWFSVQLDDGSALMAYLLRERDGGVSRTSSGTFVSPDDRVTHLPVDSFSVEVTDRWTSPESGASYPAGWILRVPSLALELRAEPLLADQERGADGGVTYWEGLCAYEGRRGGRPVRGSGHVELVGHARPFELMR